jgi:hypothetical protein
MHPHPSFGNERHEVFASEKLGEAERRKAQILGRIIGCGAR